MREPTRIPIILKRLQTIWEKNPDLRLAQLIGNVFPCTPDTQIDMYYYEDENFIRILENYYSTKRIYRVFTKKEIMELDKDATKRTKS